MKVSFNKRMTVDPGWNTGWAFWEDTIYPQTGCIHLAKTAGMITEEKLYMMWSQFETLLEMYRPKALIVESTEYWDGSLKSRTSHKRGDVHTLTLLIGGYLRDAMKMEIPFIILPSRAWKGNMNDDQVKRRVEYINGTVYRNSHIYDAVGIGLSRMKLFNIRRRKIGSSEKE